MNIWFVNQYAYTPYQAATSRHFAYARELIRRGHNVHVISSSFYHKHRRQDHYDPARVAVDGVVEGVPFLWVRTPAYKSGMRRLLNMAVFAARLVRGQVISDLPRPDVLICTSPSLLAALAGGFLARRNDAVWIAEIVDLWPDTLIEVGGMSTLHPVVLMFRQIEKYIYRNADTVLTHLVKAPLHFQELGALPEKTHFIPSASPFDPIPDPPEESHNDRLTFGYIGAIGKSNAMGALLDAWELLYRNAPSEAANMRLILLGDGEERPALEKRVAGQTWQDTISFYDPVPKSEVLGFLSNIDICLAMTADHPIYRFGISLNKMFDYMAAAKPVILATRAPATPIEASGAGIVVPPGDADALMSAMLELASSTGDDRREMGMRGHDYLVRNHHVRQWGDKAEKLLQALRTIETGGKGFSAGA